jgi:hypothetical protein
MAIVGWLASILSDKIRQREIVSVTVIRKVNNTIGDRIREKLIEGLPTSPNNSINETSKIILT